MYKVSAGEIESLMYQVVEDVLIDRQDWEAGFGLTIRKNGDIVRGDIRDTIDTADTLGSIEVDIQDNDINITFINGNASYIFGRRNLIDEIVIENMLEKMSAEVAIYMVQKYLSN